MNDERLKTILSAIEKLPADGRIWVKRDGAPEWPTDNLTTDDLTYLRTCLVEREELLDASGTIDFVIDGEDFHVGRDWDRDSDFWVEVDTYGNRTNKRLYSSPTEAFKALKETK